MPTIKGIDGPYRYYFFSSDCSEPMHVHVRRDENKCKFWLDPMRLAWNHGFSAAELGLVERAILEHREKVVEAWNEHCG